MLKSRKSKGSAMFMLLTIVGILYVLGMMLIDYMIGERYQTTRIGESMQAYYLAEAAVEKAMIKVREVFKESLYENGEINERLLSLLDIDKAENFSMRINIPEGDIIPDGSAEVLIQVSNVRVTPFKGYIDELEEIPRSLEIFRKKKREIYAEKALGGWEGYLRFEAIGKYKRAERTIEVMRELKVSDLTPPAENYTLFVTARKDEYLRYGEFRCRNWSVVRDLKALIDELVKKTGDAFQETLGNTANEFFWEPNLASNMSFEGETKMRTLKVIRKLVMSVSDVRIKDFVDSSIQKLNPYHWGKIRSNGRLHVYLPFFAADDIINYFEDNSIFSHQRPEIGYLFCSNQLHDPYLSKYTFYEGEIIKYFQKLKPYVLGITETPYPSSDPYTINTKFDFVSRNPTQLQPMQLDRIKKNAKDYCHEFIEKDLKVMGTYSKPAKLMGLIYVQGDVRLGGRIGGQAMIVTTGDVYIDETVVHDDAESFLSIVALDGQVKVNKTLQNAKIEAAIYAKNSITGGEYINIFGNLCVDTLNRQNGEEGALIMPKRVVIDYDANIKSKIGGNVCFNVSELVTTSRDL